MQAFDKDINAVIFDCDGVIINSEAVGQTALRSLLARYFAEETLERALERLRGQMLVPTLQQIFRETGCSICSEDIERIELALDDTIARLAEPMEGMREVVLACKVPIAIASNASLAWITEAVRRLDASDIFVDRLFSADHVQRPKPAPDVYLLAAQALAVLPTTCVAVEDSAAGVIAAVAAGMRVIGFCGTSPDPAAHRDVLCAAGAYPVVGSAKELLNLLRCFE